jgi:hypothetical protein
MALVLLGVGAGGADKGGGGCELDDDDPRPWNPPKCGIIDVTDDHLRVCVGAGVDAGADIGVPATGCAATGTGAGEGGGGGGGGSIGEGGGSIGEGGGGARTTGLSHFSKNRMIGMSAVNVIWVFIGELGNGR